MIDEALKRATEKVRTGRKTSWSSLASQLHHRGHLGTDIRCSRPGPEGHDLRIQACDVLLRCSPGCIAIDLTIGWRQLRVTHTATVNMNVCITGPPTFRYPLLRLPIDYFAKILLSANVYEYSAAASNAL